MFSEIGESRAVWGLSLNEVGVTLVAKETPEGSVGSTGMVQTSRWPSDSVLLDPLVLSAGMVKTIIGSFRRRDNQRYRKRGEGMRERRVDGTRGC